MTRLVPLLVLLALTGLSCRRQASVERVELPPAEVSDMTAEAEAWADSVCASLSIEEKTAQLFMPAIYSQTDAWTLRLIRRYAASGIGGVILLKGDVQGATALADSLYHLSFIYPFIAVDAEWGLAMRLADAPRFPANNAIGAEADDRLMYDYGREVARECRRIGINMVLGPVVDVSGPDSFMLRRSFGNDPRRVADLALAYARGLEDGNVVSVAKHFPGHGSVSADSHKTKGFIMRSLNEMDSIDLYPFRKWVEQRLSAVMVGHLAVPSIDSEMLPAAVSPTVISDLLRDDLGFSGLVITDALNMKGAEGYTALDALRAGADIIIAPGDTFAEIENITGAVRRGEIEESEIDAHVRRILLHKYLLGAASGGKRPYDSGPLHGAEADSIALRLLK